MLFLSSADFFQNKLFQNIPLETVCKGYQEMTKLQLARKESKDSEESKNTFEQQHEISNNVVCGTSKGSDQPAHTHSLIRAFASRLNIL